jgi:hydrogenase maturation protease
LKKDLGIYGDQGIENRSVRRPIAVVGCGNWRVAADSTGPAILRRLVGRYGEEVETYDIGASALELLDCLSGQELMLIVDSSRGSGSPGEISLIEPDFDAVAADLPSLHQIGPLETLLVAAHLYPEKMPERVQLVLVETEGLAESALEGLIGPVVSVIDREIERHAICQEGLQNEVPVMK